MEDLFAALSGVVLFSKLDLSHEYKQLVIEGSTPLPPQQRNCFNMYDCLFGISSAPEIFQRTIETLLRDIPGVVVSLVVALVNTIAIWIRS